MAGIGLIVSGLPVYVYFSRRRSDAEKEEDALPPHGD
jgi:hypothetical protein